MKNHFFMIMIFLPSLLFAQNFESSFRANGLTNLKTAAPLVRTALAYSTTNNFLHQDVYGNLEEAYLRPEAAEKLRSASLALQKTYPELRLLILDAARPRSIQREMWAIVKGTDQQGFVANPASGSIHNFGMAVDLTIEYTNGIPLDMGTPFDFFGPLAEPRNEAAFLKSGQLSPLQLSNRLILRTVMTNAGFGFIRNEWWHFEAEDKKTVRSNYRMIE